MTTLSLPTHINSVAHLVSGLGMGVSLKSVDVFEVNIVNSHKKVSVIGIEGKVKRLASAVQQLTDVTLAYEAGYQIHFSCSLESSVFGDYASIGFFSEQDAIDFIKKNNGSFFLDLFNSLLGLEAWENISITVQNKAVLDFLEAEGLVHQIDEANSTEYELDDDESVNCLVNIDEHRASELLGEVQNQMTGYSTDEENVSLSSELVVALKNTITEKAIEELS